MPQQGFVVVLKVVINISFSVINEGLVWNLLYGTVNPLQSCPIVFQVEVAHRDLGLVTAVIGSNRGADFVCFYSFEVIFFPVVISTLVPEVTNVIWSYFQSLFVQFLSSLVVFFIVVAKTHMVEAFMACRFHLKCFFEGFNGLIVILQIVVTKSNLMVKGFLIWWF